MPKTEKLQDGTEILIRELVPGDFEDLMAFFLKLAEEDRLYLRLDVTNRKTVQQRLNLMDFGYHHRLIAIHDNEIVAEGALELPFEDWRRHQGELRLVVAKAFQRRGLGMLIMKELYCLSLRHKVETVVVWMMKPQAAALSLGRKMGFHDECVLPSYVRDQKGEMHDLIILKGKTENLLKEIERFFGPINWQQCV
jgi:GNAT superfamily N-acetyltransferase